MLETCRREFSRAARAGESVSILSIDVDHFKKYNDNHGHDAGDMVLRAVGQCLDGLFPSARIRLGDRTAFVGAAARNGLPLISRQI